MNDKQARMAEAAKAIGFRECKQPDPLRAAAARCLDAACILGILTWLGWSIHTIAGWFG